MSEALQRAALNIIPDAVITMDEDGLIHSFNPIAQHVFGYSTEEVIGQPLRVLMPERFREPHEKGLRRYLETGEGHLIGQGPVELTGLRKCSEEFPLALSLGEMYEGGERLFVGIIRDVTERKLTEAELRESEERFRSAFDNTPVGMALVDLEGRYQQVNQALCELLGYSEEEFLNTTFQEITYPEDYEKSMAWAHRLWERETYSYTLEKRYVHAEGHPVWVFLSVSLVREQEGNVLYHIAQVQDITGRKQAEEALRESEERFRSLVELAPDAVAVHSEGEIVYANPAAAELFGASGPEELIGRKALDLVHPDYRETVKARIKRALKEGEVAPLQEEKYLRLDGSILDVEVAGAPIHYRGKPAVQAIFRDIIDRKALEKQLRYQAFHDSLTGLPNRTLFTDRLDHALARASRQGNKIAVLFTDLDNFKYVNDSLGHEMGDRLLVLFARRLTETLRPGDTIARLGGDEFTILLEDVADARDAKRAAERIEEALEPPLTLDGRDIFVSASIGITLSGSPDDQPQDLLRQADMAMYQAKNRGKAGHVLFVPRMQLPVVEHLQLGSELGKALKQDELRVYYQPKVRLDTDVQLECSSSGRPTISSASEMGKGCRIVGMEALVRWEHPERGLLSPKEFIHIAEETGLILPLGRRVLEEACRKAGAWQEQYPNDPPLEMCVNLSARQFQDPELVQDVARVLQETGLEPRRLQLEITESVIMEDASSTITTLEKLTDLGVQLSIDDFGTGYSSLSYLKRFPVSLLKIDRSFTDGLGKAPEDSAIISGIINLAHTLDMKVVAEGVETAGQATHLQGLGCDLAQGNYFSKPLSGEELKGLLKRHRSTHS